jgi:polysaccharide biosynthesis protein PslG
LNAMKSRKSIAVPLLAVLAVAVALAQGTSGVASSSGPTPKGFFGVAPQTSLTPEDARYMKAGGIETVRWPLIWAGIQPAAKGGYDWSSVDQTVETAARAGLRILPSLGSTPRWLARKPTTLPIDNAKQRAAWTAFLQAAVERYGPGGEFWREHSGRPTGGLPTYEPAPVPAAIKPLPIREWQVWNEPNFFYFAYPASPTRYARLIQISGAAIKGANRGAKVILAGMFGRPTAHGSRGMPAAQFLQRLYRVPGIKSRFDGVSLHPYAVDSETLEEIVEEFHNVVVENHDRVGLNITEMGWGSQNDFEQVAFEQGIQGQVRQLRDAYGYLIENQRRLNLKQVVWFSWKDIAGACTFCDSVGFFREGPHFRPKPAWHAFVALTGGRPRP